MTTPVRVLAFVVGLAAVFAIALGLGTAVGPLGAPVAEHDGMAESGEDTHGTQAGHDAEPVGLPGGLAVSEGGYTLRLAEDTAPAGESVPLRFTIEGPDGAPVTAYDVEHEKLLHLVVVRRDLTGFQHVHPDLADDGTWSTNVDLRPGGWRVFADFTPTGATGTILGADLSVPGDYRPAGDAPDTTTTEVDGYTVTLDGELVAGAAVPVTLTVSRAGEPVTDLEPYLGAYGHLVALRDGDLAYLHVHPEDAAAPGPVVGFTVEVPTDGAYRLFLDFRHDGVVRTAELAVTTHGSHG